MRDGLGLGAVAVVAAISVIASACGRTDTAASTTTPAIEVPSITAAEMPPTVETLSPPDGAGPVVAVVWGSFGQFDIAPLLVVDEAGRTLAYGGGLTSVRDVSVCPGSKKLTVLGDGADGSLAVSVWDLSNFEMEDSWLVERLVREVRCVSSNGQRSVLYRGPSGMDPSPPTSAGPTTAAPTTTLLDGSSEATGPNSWALFRLDHGAVTTLYDPDEYGKILAFTPHWAIASHTTTLWIVDLTEDAHATVLTTPFPAAAAIDPDQSSVIVAGQYPNSGEPGHLTVFSLGSDPELVADTTISGTAWTWPLAWIDANRFVQGTTIYDRNLVPVTTWSEPIRNLAIAGAFVLGTESIGQWEDALVQVEAATGLVSPIRSFPGHVRGIAAVDDGPAVTVEAHTRIPERTYAPPPTGTVATAPPVQLPHIGIVDHGVLDDLRTLVIDASGDGDRVRADAVEYASGNLVDVPMADIDACSGVGFAAGASSSQPLAVSDVAGATVIVYAFTTEADVTVAAVEPATCEILDTVGPLLSPGPGRNITTIPSP